MASRRDWLLQQLGITQWTLHRPAVLQGEIAVALPADVRLIVVAETLPSQDQPLIGDVLRTLALQPEQVCYLTPDQVAMLPTEVPCPVWCLGLSAPPPLTGVQLPTPALGALSNDAGAKRALWRQICEYEDDFYPDRGRSGQRMAD